jgi:hypothetical protein
MKKSQLILLSALMLLCIAANVIGAGEPIVQATITVYPSVIVPGNDGYVQLVFKNIGTATASRIKIAGVATDAPIKFSNWFTELGALGSSDSSTTILKFSVLESASPGLYSITFTIDYCQDSICKTIYPTGIINVQSLATVEITSIKPKSLRLGEMANMTFTITNKGDTITNAIFTWVSPDGALLPIGSTNRMIIPTISTNSYYEACSEVVVSSTTTPGIHPININIQYVDRSGINQTITSVAGIEISGETDFDVTLQDYTAGSVTLAIINIGSTSAYSTVVRIPQQEHFRVVGTSSSVVGNLNAGDYTQTNFQIMPLRANITENLLVEISYTDLLGVRRNLQKEVLITATNVSTMMRRRVVSQQPTLFSHSLIYIIIGIVGIVCIIAIVKLRKIIKKK